MLEWFMPGDVVETAAVRWLRRVLKGEVVNGEVGIRLRDGPFNGRTYIVALDEEGNPPQQVRGRRGGHAWHRYLLVANPSETTSWIYLYHGEDSTTDDGSS